MSELCVFCMRRDVSSCQFICKVLFVFGFGFGFGFVCVKFVYSVRRLHALGVCLAPVQLKLDQNNPRASRGGESFDKFFFETFQHQNILIVKTWYQNPLFQYMSIYDGHGHVALVFTEELVTGT